MLTVRDIEEFIFCPRLFYYHVVLGIEKKKGFWSETGKMFEEEIRDNVIQTISNEYEILESKIFENQEYQIRYKPDILARHKKTKFYVVGEIKNSKRVKPEFLGSLYVYAFCLSSMVLDR
jgi:CRISPR/Cas system-associated exonuclease Cas4 (RecB family)